MFPSATLLHRATGVGPVEYRKVLVPPLPVHLGIEDVAGDRDAFFCYRSGHAVTGSSRRFHSPSKPLSGSGASFFAMMLLAAWTIFFVER